MRIIINGSSMVPIYEQITDQIKEQIMAGALCPWIVKGAEEQRADGEKGI